MRIRIELHPQKYGATGRVHLTFLKLGVDDSEKPEFRYNYVLLATYS